METKQLKTALKYSIFGLVLIAVMVWLINAAFGDLGLLLIAIGAGGIAGGFTLALVGGESYGLKMPGMHGTSAEKIDPGFLGDVFVGLMAASLGIGIGIWTKIFHVSLFDLKATSFVELWFTDFAIAYTCGFLGLRLVKAVSASVLKQADLQEKLEKVSTNEADNLYLNVLELVRGNQPQAAIDLLARVEMLDGENSIRALIGRAYAEKRLGKFGDAIATLDQAIGRSPREKHAHRIPVAYWNRACYRTLTCDNNFDQYLDSIINDLRKSIELQPSFRHDLEKDEDLKALQENPKFKALL